MKHKLSFFNKTIFKKNITLYWPIWGIYTFVIMCSMPVSLWLRFYSYSYSYTVETKTSMLYDVLEMADFHIVLIAITAVIEGMALFHYMYHTKSAYMIHALPTNRAELFGTNILSGIVFLAVPQIVTFLATVFVCLSAGVTRIEYIGMWLLVMLATDVIAFSIVTICAMFTGLMLALPVYVVAANCLAWVIGALMDIMVQLYAYGYGSGASAMESSVVKWLSPLVCYLSMVDLKQVAWGETEWGIKLQGIDCILIYLVVAVVLYIVAYWLYQKRHIEQAGNLVAISGLKRFVCYGVSVLLGIYGTFLVSVILELYSYSVFRTPSFYVWLVIQSMIFFFIADMLVKKTFRVFKRENWIAAGIACLITLACYGGLHGYAELKQYEVPEVENIKSVTVRMNYWMDLDGPESQLAVEAHQLILDNLTYLEKVDEEGLYSYEETKTIIFEYYLYDGTYMQRYYKIPMDDGLGQSIIDQFTEYENTAEWFLESLGIEDYKEITDFVAGEVTYATYEFWKDGVVLSAESKNVELTLEESERLFSAMIADVEAGTLQKYKNETDDIYLLSFNFYDPEEPEKIIQITVRYGKDCASILNELVSLGYLESLEHFCWEAPYAVTPDLEVYLGDIFCYEYEQVEQFQYGEVQLGYHTLDENGQKQSVYGTCLLTDDAQTKVIYDAICQEWIDGTLIKYNTYYYPYYVTDEYSGPDNVYTILLDFVVPNTNGMGDSVIRFGSDCERIIQALERVGIIEDADAICWDCSEYDLDYDEDEESIKEMLAAYTQWSDVTGTLYYERYDFVPRTLTEEQCMKLCETAIRKMQEEEFRIHTKYHSYASAYTVSLYFTAPDSNWSQTLEFSFGYCDSFFQSVLLELGLSAE